jgi:TonB-dependent SusC/RagA subfamily outer membrane receptor
MNVGDGGAAAPSRLDDIDPSSIERVEILKGAAAATLYGTEASNGVIQIFTKKGTLGRRSGTLTCRATCCATPTIAWSRTGACRSRRPPPVH